MFHAQAVQQREGKLSGALDDYRGFAHFFPQCITCEFVGDGVDMDIRVQLVDTFSE